MDSLWESVESKLRFLLAIPLAFVPRRHWAALDETAPVSRAAAISGILTFFLAAALFIPAYLEFVQQGSSDAIDRLLVATGWRGAHAAAEVAGTPDRQVGAAQAQWAVGFLSIFTFVAMTPIGLLSAYLGMTGWFRAISVWVDDARGDPVLTLIDRIVFRSRMKRDATRARGARQALEGVQVADRVMSGEQAGIPGAEIVVTTSRRKPDWVKGTYIITEEKWYRLGDPVERHTPNGLRTLYPLNEVTDLEVLRKGIQYDLKGKGR